MVTIESLWRLLKVLYHNVFNSKSVNTFVISFINHCRARNFSLNPLGDQNFSTWEVRSESPHKITLYKLGIYAKSQNFTGKFWKMILKSCPTNNVK